MRVALRSRGARLATALALVAMLALAGCGARVPRSGAPSAGQDASIQDVQSASLGVLGLSAALATAETDANFDYASLENEIQP